MAITVPTSKFGEGTLPFTDAIQEIKKRVRPNEVESLRDAAPYLHALGKNRRFLIDALISETQKRCEAQATGLQDTSLVLYQDPEIMIRANFWFPYDSFPAHYASRASSLGYLIPHNHDFHFLTLGYWGSGYHTTIYKCDISPNVVLSPGDSVDLVFLENTVLHEGKLMIYRASQDVHFQDHPPDFSVSLNVVLLPRHQNTGQHLFDISNKTVQVVLDYSRSQILACKLAAISQDPCFLEDLRDIEKKSPNEMVRAAASSAITTILND